MKFIVDAQLPELLKNWLNEQGDDAIHTSDMPLKEQTPDMHIIELADEEDRIVISKDSDFFLNITSSQANLAVFSWSQRKISSIKS